MLFSIGLPFLVVYLRDRTRRWALIPAFVLIAVGFFPLLTTQVSEDIIGAFVLFAIAMPFLVIYLLANRNWWALVPAGVMGSIALLVLLQGLTRFSPQRDPC